MAFCSACGKVTWSPVGCKCAPAREPGQLRAAYEAARERARARAADPARQPDPVQPTLPDRPSLRDLVREERARRTDT